MEKNITDTKVNIESYEQFIDEYSIYYFDQFMQNKNKEAMTLKEFAEKRCGFIHPIHGRLFSNLQ